MLLFLYLGFMEIVNSKPLCNRRQEGSRMASTSINSYFAFTVYLDGSDEENKKRETESMQAAFEKFRRRRQVGLTSFSQVRWGQLGSVWKVHVFQQEMESFSTAKYCFWWLWFSENKVCFSLPWRGKALSRCVEQGLPTPTSCRAPVPASTSCRAPPPTSCSRRILAGRWKQLTVGAGVQWNRLSQGWSKTFCHLLWHILIRGAFLLWHCNPPLSSTLQFCPPLPMPSVDGSRWIEVDASYQ